MRSIRAQPRGFDQRLVARVATLSSLATEWTPELQFLVPIRSDADAVALERLRMGGLSNIYPLTDRPEDLSRSGIGVRAERGAIEDGDVVAITPGRALLSILMRESDRHHTVFLTNRCNSLCVMCSQPPTQWDDTWLVDEALAVAAHIRRPPAIVGVTGGEPLLLGSALRDVLDAFTDRLPTTDLDVLTNGRLLSNGRLASTILSGLSSRVTWMVPLYGHADLLHDEIVQAPGAFDQTIDGLLTLQAFEAPVQLRIVLIEPVLRALPDICDFISLNLPFVREVALMGCEPIGFALTNRDACAVDIAHWHAQLLKGVQRLERADVPVVLMNLPLCGLPPGLRPLAHRSISDWKQVFPSECDPCVLREECCGLFAWADRRWRPTTLRPVTDMAPS